MISTIVFLLFLGIPFIAYLVNALVAKRESRGIAAGIPRPKQAKAPKAARARGGRVRQRRAVYCGREFTHLALAVLGSQDSCRYCSYLQEVPPPSPGDDSDDTDAAIRAAEEIIDRAKQ